MFSLFHSGGEFDYQRPGGYMDAKLNGNFVMAYRDVTNYNYGVVAGAAGYNLTDALNGAETYNRVFGNTNANLTGYGITQSAVNNISQGWHDYTSGSWKH